MSDISRTDTSIYFTEHSQMYDIASEMKKLERELYAANERIKLLEAANSDVHRIANERNVAYQHIEELKRAGNELAAWANVLYDNTNVLSLDQYSGIKRDLKDWEKANQ